MSMKINLPLINLPYRFDGFGKLIRGKLMAEEGNLHGLSQIAFDVGAAQRCQTLLMSARVEAGSRMALTSALYPDLLAPPLLVNSDVLALQLVKLCPNSRGEGDGG